MSQPLNASGNLLRLSRATVAPKASEPSIISGLLAMVDAPKTGPSPASNLLSLVASPEPVVATPEPVVAKPVVAKAKVVHATWAKLPDGEWGIRAGVDCLPGDKVTVVKKNGQRSTVTLGAKSAKIGVFYKAGAKAKAKPKAQRQCIGNGNCRRRGWKKGPNCDPYY